MGANFTCPLRRDLEVLDLLFINKSNRLYQLTACVFLASSLWGCFDLTTAELKDTDSQTTDTDTDPTSNCVFYVKDIPNSSSGDGSTWSKATNNIQEAIDAADLAISEGRATACEVWVAEGSYVLYGSRDNTDHRSDTLELKNAVSLYGGFAGRETERDERNWKTHKTVLDGQSKEQENVEYVFNIMTAREINETLVLDGFVIQNGMANGSQETTQRGGALNSKSSRVNIFNCTFRNNYAQQQGGAIFSFQSVLHLENCTFDENSTGPLLESSGGAVYVSEGVLQDINNNYSGNQSTSGGAIYFHKGEHEVESSTFQVNAADQTGGAIYYDTSDYFITDTHFVENTAGESAGALYSQGTRSNSLLYRIERSVFEKNSSGKKGYGGAIYAKEDHLVIDDCQFLGNSAPLTGGAIASESTVSKQNEKFLRISNSVFRGNYSGDWGGGAIMNIGNTLAVDSSVFTGNHTLSPTQGGHSVFSMNASLRFANCTFAMNKVPPDPENGPVNTDDEKENIIVLFVEYPSVSGEDFDAVIEIQNCIMWQNSLHELLITTSKNVTVKQVSVTDSIVFGSLPENTEKTNIWQEDPLFVDTKAAQWDLHLKKNSPAIDRGNDNAPNTDLEGNLRVDVDGLPQLAECEIDDSAELCTRKADLGAYEWKGGSGTGN